MGVILVAVILVATTLGSVCGLGGGVIIKPVLDAISPYSTFQIALISCVCVLVMSVTSVIKRILNHDKIDYKMSVLLAVGSVLGGLAGNTAFRAVKSGVMASMPANGEQVLKLIQNSLLAVLMIFVIFYMMVLKKRNVVFHLKSAPIILLIGFVLGAASVFLDIGGGPINVAVFCLLFGLGIRQASVCSLITIVFAQTTKLVQYALNGSFLANAVFDEKLSLTVFIIFAAVSVCSGFIGSHLNKKLHENTINKVYCAALFAILAIVAYNIISNAVALGTVV